MWGDLFCSVATFYFSAGQEHLIAYFSDIAAAIDLPILVYDNPVMTKNRVLPATVELCVDAFPASLASRRVTRNGVNLENLLDLTRDDKEFSVLTGNECLILAGCRWAAPDSLEDCTT